MNQGDVCLELGGAARLAISYTEGKNTHIGDNHGQDVARELDEKMDRNKKTSRTCIFVLGSLLGIAIGVPAVRAFAIVSLLIQLYLCAIS